MATERLARGKSTAFSIGYLILQDDRTAEGRKLLDLPLLEVSLANVPANPAALVTGVKSGVPAALPFDAEASGVRAALEAFVTRAQALADLRARDGRPLGPAAKSVLADLGATIRTERDALGGLAAALDALLAPPAPATPDPRPLIQEELRRYLVREGRLRGLTP